MDVYETKKLFNVIVYYKNSFHHLNPQLTFKI